jgi:DNA replication protein DnaC
LKKSQNLIFLGPPGVGKTHLAVSIALEAIRKGLKTYFMLAQELVTSLLSTDVQGKLDKRMRGLAEPSLLTIDGMGFLTCQITVAIIYSKLSVEGMKKSSISILTSNKAFSQYGEVLIDGILATATLDRLLYHSRFFFFEGSSYRLKPNGTD